MDHFNIERLFQLRLAIARIGEMDNAGWWNTKGLLANSGAFVFKRGFPTTHAFAQARVVFAVAANRCHEVFAPPQCATLWQLPVAIEEAFEDQLQLWLDDVSRWQPFFAAVAGIRGTDVLSTLRALALITEADVALVQRLKRSPDRPAVLIPGQGLNDATLTLLATGFALATPGKLVVPYVPVL